MLLFIILLLFYIIGLDNLEIIANSVLDNYSEYVKNVTNHVYDDNLKTILEQKNPLLDDYVKYYVLCKMNPDSSEYPNYFSNVKTNLIQVKSALMELLSEAQTNTDNVSKQIIKLNDSLKTEKDKNTILKNKLKNTDTKMNATVELISNYTEIYDSNYMKNWALFFSIIIIWFITKKVYF